MSADEPVRTTDRLARGHLSDQPLLRDVSEDTSPAITAESSESPLHTTRTDHVTLVGGNKEDRTEFYCDVLRMALVLRQPNLDNPDATNLFFDSGDGRIVTFFVTDDRQSDASPLRHRTGSVQRIR